MLIVGHANGQLQGNRHVRAADETPTSNLLLSLLHKLGIEQEMIGDSTGTLAL